MWSSKTVLLSNSPTTFAGQPAGTRAVQLPDDSFNKTSYFLTVFGRPEMDSACECERADGASLAQTLHLLNSKGIQDKLASNSGTAAKFAMDKEAAVADKMGELYLRAFSRQPLEREVQIAQEYVAAKVRQAEQNQADPVAAEKSAYEDLVWAILNTKEFLFNH